MIRSARSTRDATTAHDGDGDGDSTRLGGMEQPFVVELDGGRCARAVRVARPGDLGAAVRKLDVGRRGAIVVVGGAGGMSDAEVRRLAPLFDGVVAPLAQRLGVAVIDGGSDTGVMRLMGSARGEGEWTFPLIGVIVDELANYSSGSDAEAAELEPNHTHFVLVPGSDWGEEAPWLARLATVVAGSEESESATVLVNGGEIALADVRHSIDADRHVIVLDGSGRTADALAAAVRGEETDPSMTALAESGLVHAVDVGDRNAFASLLDDLLVGRAVP